MDAIAHDVTAPEKLRAIYKAQPAAARDMLVTTASFPTIGAVTKAAQKGRD